MRGHLIHNGRDPRFRVWRCPSNKNSLNKEWEEEFRRLTKQQTQPLNVAIDMQAMVANAFQQLNDPISLEDILVDIVEDVLKIVDGLQQEANEGDRDGDGKVPFNNEGQQPSGDTSFDDVQQEHNFDLMALEDAMEELYVGSKCTKLATIFFLMNLLLRIQAQLVKFH